MVASAEGKGWCLMTHPAGDSRAYHTGRREWRLPASRCQATECGVDNRPAVRGVQKCVVKWACVEEGGRYEAKRVYSTCGWRDGGGCVAGLRRAGRETRIARFTGDDARGEAGGAACSAAQICGE